MPIHVSEPLEIMVTLQQKAVCKMSIVIIWAVLKKNKKHVWSTCLTHLNRSLFSFLLNNTSIPHLF